MQQDNGRSHTLAHIRLVAGFPGCWELRALRRLGGNRMSSQGSFFLLATETTDGLVYDRLDEAIDWADRQSEHGSEVFLGMNPRDRARGDKESVSRVTSCFVDLDLPDGYS